MATYTVPPTTAATTTTPPAGAQLWVVGGPCVTGASGCVTSPNFPNNYGNSQACAVGVKPGVSVTATRFATEPGYDKLLANGDVLQRHHWSPKRGSGWQHHVVV